MKLIKSEDEQGTMYSLSGDNLPDNYVLSKQNCDSLFGVIDVEKLAQEFLEKHKFASSHIADITSFKYGFNKAMDLNKDKVFTQQDMQDCWDTAERVGRLKEIGMDSPDWIEFEEYKKQIQQPTEIDVVIVLEEKYGWDLHSTPPQKEFSHLEPKLDSEGQLILKKI
jgi:hypothetical protein